MTHRHFYGIQWNPLVKLQQAWKKLLFFRKKSGLTSTNEESVSLPKEKRKSVKRVAQSDRTSIKRGRKKAMPGLSSIPVEIPVPLEEQIHDPLLPSPQPLHKEKTV